MSAAADPTERCSAADPTERCSPLVDGPGTALVLRYLYFARSIAVAQDSPQYRVLDEMGVPGGYELARRYLAAVNEWADQWPSSAAEAGALVEFAAAVIADGPVQEAGNCSGPVSDDLDRHYAAQALIAASYWLNRRAFAEYAAAERARDGVVVE